MQLGYREIRSWVHVCCCPLAPTNVAFGSNFTPNPISLCPPFVGRFVRIFFLADRDETEREKRHSRHDFGVVVVRCGRPRTVHLMGTSSRPSRYNLWTRLSATTAVLAVWITWSVANMIYRVVRSVAHSQSRDLMLVCLELLTCVLWLKIHTRRVGRRGWKNWYLALSSARGCVTHDLFYVIWFK